MRSTIRTTLRRLPDEYGDDLWDAKVAATVDWVFRRYGGLYGCAGSGTGRQ